MEEQSQQKPPAQHGSDALTIQENWLAVKNGHASLAVLECPFFTDARIVGELVQQSWPYAFLNTVPMHEEPGLVQMPLVLRIHYHLDGFPGAIDWKKTDATRYHGGWLWDEVAALTSLCMGVRMKSGEPMRRFSASDADQFGRPTSAAAFRLPVIGLDKRRLVLPRVARTIGETETLRRLESITWLRHGDVTALVKAARLYQEALWIAESDPGMAWLLLVSAIETAAEHWRSDHGSPSERLQESKPALKERLHAAGGDELVDFVANEIIDSLGATNKFVKFVLEHLPPEPKDRPSPAFQIPWSKTKLRENLGLIYKHRSDALHGGTPFPAPMCEAPYFDQESKQFADKPLGLASKSHGSVWTAADTPILLHAFEYISRGALTTWWDSMANQVKGSAKAVPARAVPARHR